MVARSLTILMLHNRYQYAGGEDSVAHQETQMLRQAGHQVELLERSNAEIQNYTQRQKLSLFWQTTWNAHSAAWLKQQLVAIQPDLVHVHNFFPLLSPSIYSVARRQGIPIVQHLHNFRLGCLNAYLYRNGQVCEACVGRNPWRGVMHRCYRGSLPASLSLWQMLTVHRWRPTWHRDVDAFITPSRFAANKLVDIGIPPEKLHVQPNTVDDPLTGEVLPPPSIPTFVFVGRLSPEKGVAELLQAWRQVNQPTWRLWIVGDGPQRSPLEALCQQHQLQSVTFWGFCPANQIFDLMQQATALVLPCRWYETFGRVVVEAFACGRPALVSDLGAVAELVDDGTTGFKVPYTDTAAWAERITWCGHNPQAMAQFGARARQQYLENYTPEINYHQLIAIYRKIL